MERYRTVEDFIAGHDAWSAHLTKLRSAILATGLEETIKWGAPCYTHHGKNVAGIGAFKSYFGVWFFQGALLADSHGLLTNAQEGKTKALRQWRMQHGKDIKVRILKAYLREAITLQEQGKQIPADRRPKQLEVPAELATVLEGNRSVAAKFAALTPGRQREYADYVASAKRADTREKRLAKILPLIRQGIGLNDHYRSK